jgi:predicted O-methyltransferase YrrM
MNLLEDYILSHIDEEGELLAALNRDAHVNLLRPRMLSGHLQGKLLKMFCRMCHPEYILEVGTYTGYATICMAEGLHEGGKIHTIEINDELEDFINRQFEKSGMKEKIHLHIGDAVNVIPSFDFQFDMVFIDADKRHYCEYYDLIFDKLKPGGLLIADNTLWNEKVLEESHHNDHQTLGIKAFNDKIASDNRIEKVIIPLRDGLTLAWKVIN